MSEIKKTEATIALLPKLGDAFIKAGIDQAEEFISTGQSCHEATSIVANLLVRAAWIVAATGADADGHAPDKDRFRAVVENTLSGVKFEDSADSSPDTEGEKP